MASAVLLSILLIAADPAAQVETGGLRSRAAACLTEPDRLACWREVAETWPPAPTPSADERAPATDLPELTLHAVVLEGQAAFFQALDAARARAAAGASAASVIEALEVLPVADAPFLPNPLSDQTLAFGRLDAFALIASAFGERRPDVAEAVLDVWERALPAENAQVATNGAESLAAERARRGQADGVDRALVMLEPENAPAAVSALIGHGRLDTAAAVADRMTTADRVAGLQAEDRAAVRRYEAVVKPLMTAALDRAMQETLAGLPSEERDEAAAAMRAYMTPDDGDVGLAARALEDGETLESLADDEVRSARIDLMRAAHGAGRDDLALPIARALADQPGRLDGWSESSGLVSALDVLASGPGAEGERAMADAERKLSRTDRRRFPLGSLYRGWVRVGRPDRATALLARWRPFAEAQGAAWTSRTAASTEHRLLDPYGGASVAQDLTAILIEQDRVAEAEALGVFVPQALLRHDAERGHGLARLDERLSGRTVEQRFSMLLDCGGAMTDQRLEDQATCLTRAEAIAETAPQRAAVSLNRLSLAMAFARLGDQHRGAATLAEALAGEGPSADYGSDDFQIDLALTAVLDAGR